MALFPTRLAYSPSGGMQAPDGWDCHTYSKLYQQILVVAGTAGSPFDVLPLIPPWSKEVEPSSVGYLLQPFPLAPPPFQSLS